MWQFHRKRTFTFPLLQTLLNRVRILASLNGMEFSEIIKLRLQNLSDKGSKKTGNFRTFIKKGAGSEF